MLTEHTVEPIMFNSFSCDLHPKYILEVKHCHYWQVEYLPPPSMLSLISLYTKQNMILTLHHQDVSETQSNLYLYSYI